MWLAILWLAVPLVLATLPEQIFWSLTKFKNVYSMSFVSFQSAADDCGKSVLRMVEIGQHMKRFAPKEVFGNSTIGYSYGEKIEPDTNWRTHHLIQTWELKPNANYRFVVGTENCGFSDWYRFRALDEEDTTGTACAFADLGNVHIENGESPLASIANAGCDYVLVIGDMGYNIYQDEGRNGDYFFNAMQTIGTSMPIVFVIGDHEWNKRPTIETSFHYQIFKEYLQCYKLYAHHVELFYHFTMHGITFRVLNTDHYLTRTNTTGEDPLVYPTNDDKNAFVHWLTQDFTQDQPSLPHQHIVLGHRSVYCHKSVDLECNELAEGSETKQLQAKLDDLFFKNKVSLVLSGHTHHYERSWPVHFNTVTAKHYKQPKAPVYIVTGSAGQNCDQFSVPQPAFSAFRDSGCTYSYTRIRYSSYSFQVDQLHNRNGSMLDHFVMDYTPSPSVKRVA